MPDLPNNVDVKPPFSASNYKKFTSRPSTAAAAAEEEPFRSHQSKNVNSLGFQNTLKMNAKPTKTSVDHILKQAAAGENAGPRQTHLSKEEDGESIRDMFGNNAGHSATPANVIRACWLAVLLMTLSL